MEPLPAVELNNDIVSLQDEERAEVIRILRDLTARVGDRAADLAPRSTCWASWTRCRRSAPRPRHETRVAPEIAEAAAARPADARHPLLLPALTERLGMERGRAASRCR